MLRDIGTERRVPIGRADRYIDAVPLFWLNYRDPDGRPAGVVVLESSALIQARMKAAVLGLDPGLECDGYQLDEASATQIPKEMIGRLLDDGDLRRLQRMLLTKKPPAASVRHPPVSRGVGM